MSRVDMAQFGISGVTYHFSDKIRYFKRASDDEKFMCKVAPSQLSIDSLNDLAEFLELTTDDLAESLIDLTDALKEQSPKTQRGTSKHVDASWENVVEVDANGNPRGLNHSLIGKLLAPDYVRIEDILFKPINNIGKLVSDEMLTRDIITQLDQINAANQWTTRSNKLVKDHVITHCAEKKLGKTRGFLPVKNGLLDISTMSIIESDDIYLTSAGVNYDPDATCPGAEQLLDNMFLPEQKEMALSIIGAALSGRAAHYILCLVGGGRNGKSILLQMITRVFGDLFTAERIDKMHDSFVNQAFLGKRLTWQTEVSSKSSFTEKLKDLTGGTVLNIQYKYKNGGLQTPAQTVVVLDTNHPPVLEHSRAIEERLRFISMPRQFVEEPNDISEFKIDKALAESWEYELSGILNLLLPYSQHYLHEGTLKHDTGRCLDEYNRKANTLAVFIEEGCDCAPGLETTTTTFFKYYSKFASRQNVASLAKSQINYQLRKEFGFKVEGMKIYGIKPRPEWTITPLENE